MNTPETFHTLHGLGGYLLRKSPRVYARSVPTLSKLRCRSTPRALPTPVCSENGLSWYLRMHGGKLVR